MVVNLVPMFDNYRQFDTSI